MAQLVVALDENGWSADQVQEDVSEILFDCEATISVTDVGIGPYEFWGSRGCDSRLEVDEVTGDDVVVPVVFESSGISAEEEETLKQEFFASRVCVVQSRSEEVQGIDWDVDIKWTSKAKDGSLVFSVSLA